MGADSIPCNFALELIWVGRVNEMEMGLGNGRLKGLLPTSHIEGAHPL